MIINTNDRERKEKKVLSEILPFVDSLVGIFEEKDFNQKHLDSLKQLRKRIVENEGGRESQISVEKERGEREGEA